MRVEGCRTQGCSGFRIRVIQGFVFLWSSGLGQSAVNSGISSVLGLLWSAGTVLFTGSMSDSHRV